VTGQARDRQGNGGLELRSFFFAKPLRVRSSLKRAKLGANLGMPLKRAKVEANLEPNEHQLSPVSDAARLATVAVVLARLERLLPSWRPKVNKVVPCRIDFGTSTGYIFVTDGGQIRVSSAVHPQARCKLAKALEGLAVEQYARVKPR